MPRFDRTGPCGNGPRTGRGLGDCQEGNLNEEPRSVGRGNGRGNGRGMGRGMGRGRNFSATNNTSTNNSEIELLKERIQALEEGLVLTKEKLSKGE